VGGGDGGVGGGSCCVGMERLVMDQGGVSKGVRSRVGKSAREISVGAVVDSGSLVACRAIGLLLESRNPGSSLS